MRTLRFIVNGQTIEKDPSSDFSGLVAGTSGYLQAQFAFDNDWDGCKKAASFWCLGREYATPVIDGACMIPAEALTWKTFGVSVTGTKKDYVIPTNKITVYQERRKP